eukprot:5012812-Amphidinium_carterae.1
MRLIMWGSVLRNKRSDTCCHCVVSSLFGSAATSTASRLELTTELSSLKTFWDPHGLEEKLRSSPLHALRRATVWELQRILPVSSSHSRSFRAVGDPT